MNYANKMNNAGKTITRVPVLWATPRRWHASVQFITREAVYWPQLGREWLAASGVVFLRKDEIAWRTLSADRVPHES